jgi:hypothetical protein
MLGLRNALTRYNPVYTGVVTSGLEHWYKLDEDNLGPLEDSVGGLNMTTYMGQSLDYDGVVDHSRTENPVIHTYLGGASAFSCGARVYRNTSSGDDGVLCGAYYRRPFSLILTVSNKVQLNVINSSGSTEYVWLSTQGLQQNGEWIDIFFLFDAPSGSFRCYMNGGELDGSWDSTPPTDFTLIDYSGTESRVIVGARSNDGGVSVINTLDGLVWRAWFCAEVLSVAEAQSATSDPPNSIPAGKTGCCWTLDDGAGTTATDHWNSEVLTHNHSTIATAWSNGAKDQVLYQKCLGLGEYTNDGPGVSQGAGDTDLHAVNADFNLPAGEFTIDLWIKIPDKITDNKYIIGTRSSGGTNQGISVLTTTLLSLGFKVRVDGGSVDSLYPSTASTDWQHIFITHIVSGGVSGAVRLYVASAAESSVSLDDETATSGDFFDLSHSGQKLALFANAANLIGGTVDDCAIGDIKVYSRVLSAEEMDHNHNETKGNFGWIGK